jgi:hypothetical protein
VPTDRLVLHALSVALPALPEEPGREMPVDAIRAAPNPTADELDDMLISATRNGARLTIDIPE